MKRGEERPLPVPYLPTNKVTAVFISETASERILQSLEDSGIRCFLVSSYKNLPKGCESHCDMQISVPTNENLVVHSDIRTTPSLSYLEQAGYKIIFTKRNPEHKYPNDCLINCFPFRGCLIAKKGTSDNIFHKFFPFEDQYTFVRQGYAKCSIAPISNNALITDDSSIAKAIKEKYGCSVDLLQLDHTRAIRLPGYSYGFIGGCCGMIGSNTLAFSGNYLTHPQAKSIEAFCRRHAVECCSLSDEPLMDIGGIIPILEKTE